MRASVLSAIAAGTVAAPALAAPVITPLAINQTTASSIDSSDAVSAGGTTYFLASAEGEQRPSLWKSDGTAAGTVLVKDFSTSVVGNLMVVGSRLFFTAAPENGGGGEEGFGSGLALKGGTGSQLWTSDGTAAGTVAVPTGTSVPANVSQLTAVGDTLYVAAYDDEREYSLWSSDGTSMTDLGPGTSDPGNLTASHGRLYFSRYDNDTDSQVLNVIESAGAQPHAVTMYDARSESTRPVRFDRGLVAGGNDRLYLTGASTGSERGRLIVTDGVAGSTHPVLDGQDQPLYGSFDFGRPVPTPTGLVFQANDEYGYALRRIADDRASTAVSSPHSFDSVVSLGETLLFSADLEREPAAGREFYRLGTGDDGPVLLGDLTPGPDGTYPSNTVASATTAYLAVGTQDGEAIYRTQGTPGDLTKISGPFLTDVDDSVVTDHGLFFTGRDAQHGDEPWFAPAGGTAGLVRDLNTGLKSSELGEMLFDGGMAYFGANDGIHAAEPWVTDGTAGGTHLLKDTAAPSYSYANDFTKFAGKVYFTARGDQGTRLWVTDGTETGTHRVDSGDSFVGDGATQPTVIGGKLYFLATGVGGRTGLWVTDGTDAPHEIEVAGNSASNRGEVLTIRGAGSVPVLDWYSYGNYQRTLYGVSSEGTAEVLSTASAGGISSLTTIGSKAYFSGHGEDGSEPWVTDGTAVGTKRLADVREGDASSEPADFQVLGDGVWFTALDGANRRVPFRVAADGTVTPLDGPWAPASGTAAFTVRGSAAVGGRVYVALVRRDGDVATPALGLVEADGSAKMVHAFDSFPVTGTYPDLGDPYGFKELGGKVYFTAHDAAHGYEIWTTDGTDAGTKLLVDTVPGPETGYPDVRGMLNGKLLFTSFSDRDGTQLFTYVDVPDAPAPVPAGETPAPPAPSAASTPPAGSPAVSPTEGKPETKRVTAKVTLLAPGSYRLRGAVTLPKGATCNGTVEIKVKAGGKTVQTIKTKLKVTSQGCVYEKTVRLSDKAAKANGKRTAVVTFVGNKTVQDKKAKKVTLPRK